ncbi:MAG: pyruvate formate-lyase-activating protein [Tissierellales bacterium]|jgi:pyruvate formate lyase activating enzyme|nr:pyruvate formate-lyase-activating protein [Tissierellales bacterium]
MIGKIHSIETCGTVDGPGIRFIIFTQGCPLRCKYCHNPDTWKLSDGKDSDSESLISEIKKYRSYMEFSGGGVTITGGEPLMQSEFVSEIFKRCKEEGIHTALDTSGQASIDIAKKVLDYTDLVLLDLKSINPNIFKDLTKADLEPSIEFLNYLREQNIKTWIRHVVVPGITDNLIDLENLAKFIAPYENIEQIELLPFHKMGEFKWESLGYNYELNDVVEPSNDLMEKSIEIFKKYNPNKIVK